MNFVIYDDDMNSGSCLYELLAQIDNDNQIIVCRYYNEFNAIICRNDCSYSAVFLDIELDDDKNGMDLVTLIRQKHPESKIVFVTAYPQKYAQSIFFLRGDAEAFAFIEKPFDNDIVLKVVEKLSEHIRSNAILSVNSGKNLYMLPLENIIYIESRGHIAEIHTTDDNVISSYIKLNEIEKTNSSLLIHCHKSFLVNLNYVIVLSSSDITVKDGTVIPLSRRYAASFRKRFMSYKCFGEG